MKEAWPVDRCAVWSPALDALPHATALLDPDGEVVAVNGAWRAFGSCNGGTGEDVGASYLAVCDAAAEQDPNAAAVASGLRDVLAGRRDVLVRTYPCHAPGEDRWFELEATPVVAEGATWVLLMHRDITRRHEAERHEAEQGRMLDAVGAAVIATDLEGRITHWSGAAAEMYGWSAEEVVGRPITEVTVLEQDAEVAGEVMASIAATGRWEGEFEVRRRDGEAFRVHVRNELLLDDEGRPRGVVGVSLDLTERVAIEEQLRAARNFLGAVTETMADGLYVLDDAGRVTFMNRAAERLLGWAREELVGEVAHDRIHARTPDGTPLPFEDCPITRGRRADAAVRVEDDHFQRRDGSFLPVSYSSAPLRSGAIDDGWVVVFTDASERKAREARLQLELEELTWVARIREALEEDRLVLHAQPILDLASGAVEAHELLVRMVDRDGRLVPPGDFLPVAERSGLIRAIDRRVLDRAFAIAASGHRIEVNLSAASIGDPELPRRVEALLLRHGADPGLVVFEITETALIGDEAAARAFVAHVRDLGCAVALDDFGTGYGSFRYLKHLAVSVLKIDREFVRDLGGPGQEANVHVIQAVVSLARGMGLRTVAEGVETDAALAALRELGVDAAQGFLLGRPAPAATVLPVGQDGPG